jgi:ABC-2 type transport system permease protein
MSAGETRVVETRYVAYHGERRGRLAAVWSLARWSALTALGSRRGFRAKIVPGFLIGVAFLPALIVIGLKALVPTFATRFPDLIPYARYYTETGVTVLFFAGLITPELLCPDRRDRVLSLYFSTAVSRVEYVAGKLLGALVPLATVAILPVLTLWMGNVVFATSPLPYLQSHWDDALRIIAAGTVLSVYFALIGLAVSSLSSRRAFAMGGYVALMVVSQLVSGFLRFGVGLGDWTFLLALGRVPLVAIRDLFGPEYSFTGNVDVVWYWVVTAAVMAVSLAIYLRRYLRGEV